jgi:hypothetical protein
VNEVAYRAILTRLGVVPATAEPSQDAEGEASTPSPGARVPADVREMLPQPATLGLAPGMPAEVYRRSLMFRHQVEQSAGGPLPLPILSGVDAKPGQCISCGDVLPAGRAHRCAVCLAAVCLALDKPALASEVLCAGGGVNSLEAPGHDRRPLL